MNFSEIIKADKDEGKEKHVPDIELDKGHKSGRDIVRVVVGHGSPHPNTVEHHIAWVELYGVRRDNGQVIDIGRAACAPVHSNPNIRFQINDIEDFKSFHALAYCNVHGLWENSLEL
ncbi:MAG: desulfoferrodoxin family protein [Deltaproteobacteria bacterium]